MDVEDKKKMAALAALDHIQDHMIIGLGTGTTVQYMLEGLAQRIQQEHLNIIGVSTSDRTTKAANALNIPMKDLDDVGHIDLTIDGAGEIDKHFQGIKDGGAAHEYEKMVAISSDKNFWIVDDSKLVDTLGHNIPLPVEVVPYGSTKVFRRLANEGLNPSFRMVDKDHFYFTHEHNYVIDLHLQQINHPHHLALWLAHQVGILEHGLFLDIVDEVFVGTDQGVKNLVPEREKRY
ncbi:ribose-5-phosphate isomerase RpiA [Agrilactobacillus fermenti]|uniref:ribose-5-phosphate isomerase RpiA n=1 Tax=Agrilactobacillus fermenti TaxID=2586909 RepID=UPI001E5B960E|nr:ribose-5-phosphate isomerase RpiA [Agrilactobacillus fermenti]MCD2255834.1 ribose-5-phosphate isomerase RpiA [Agrilactobacillus fermenti]